MSKEKPHEKPTWTTIYFEESKEIQEKMDSVKEALRTKVLNGILVTNWCDKCRGWKLNFVSSETARKHVESLLTTFPCTTCKKKLQLIIDEHHTLDPLKS